MPMILAHSLGDLASPLNMLCEQKDHKCRDGNMSRGISLFKKVYKIFDNTKRFESPLSTCQICYAGRILIWTWI